MPHQDSPSNGAPAPTPLPGAARKTARVLVVDDEPAMVRAHTRILAQAGYEVESATDGARAKELLETSEVDVILSDVHMPGLNGYELLRAVRRQNLDLPVIMVSGSAGDDAANRALEEGALFYLVKPADGRVLVHLIEQAVRLYRMAKLKRAAFERFGGGGLAAGDRAGLEVCFANALRTLWIAYQPIVHWKRREVFGFEALMRNDEPTLASPPALLACAERLGRLTDVGRTVRDRVAASLSSLPGEARVFVNLHTRDLADPLLLSPDAPLSRHSSRVVLEVTERSSLDEVSDVATRIDLLRRMGFAIAIDDLGAGYAGLTAFAQLKPEIVKLDMSLIRGVQSDPMKRKLIAAMTSLSHEMSILVVAEGIETTEERDTLESIGCDLMQGYLFARPSRLVTAIAF